jgi:hypothetical protein
MSTPTQFLSGSSGSVLVGAVKVADVTGWTFNGICSVPKVATNDTAGWKGGAAGTQDSNGTVRIAYKPGTTRTFVPGDAVSLVLENGSGNTITVPAIISQDAIEVDIDDGEITAGEYNWEGIGPAVRAGVFAKGGGGS